MVAITSPAHWRSAALTPSRATRAVMPRPISAGVLGMQRMMRSLPSQAAMLSLRMPAATLRCRALAVKALVCSAASLKVCGLTAQTTRPARSRLASGALKAAMPNSSLSLALASSKGSTTRMFWAGRPCLSRPPMMALAILPPPINAIAWVICMSVGQSTVCATACSHCAISSCARDRAMVGRKRRSARHSWLSSAVLV